VRPLRASPAAVDASFDERFDELARLAQRVAFRIVGDREEACDIAQEALVRAYARWPRVEARAGGWVARVSTNLALDHVRRRDRRQDRPLPAGDDARPAMAGAAAHPHSGERIDLLEALRRLPRRQRDVVVLRYLADLPEVEVARCLGCGVGTVKSQSHRGLAALRRHLGPDRPDRPHSPNRSDGRPAGNRPAVALVPDRPPSAGPSRPDPVNDRDTRDPGAS
jgi:RNA polymerase sigma-70 factor (sigma-E family)